MQNIIKVSDAASLALHAASLLANSPEKPLRTKEIAESLGVSEAHIAKVLQRLSLAGLVRGARGPAGGYALGRPACEITLKHIYEAIEGPRTGNSCPFGLPSCRKESCVLGEKFTEASRELLEFLGRTRLADANMSC